MTRSPDGGAADAAPGRLAGPFRRPGRLPRLHVVTDDDVLAARDFVERAREVLAAGGAEIALHLRGPRTSGRRLHALALELAGGARGSGSTLLVNDRVDVALAVPLDGVQLGGRSLPLQAARRLLPEDRLVGASVHSVEEAAAAAAAGADFLLVGTVFATPSHPDRRPAGTGLLSGVRDRVGVPLVGIGGIDPVRVPSVLAAGAHGVAVLRGVWADEDPRTAVGRFLEELARGAPIEETP